MLSPEGRIYSKSDLLNDATKIESAMRGYYEALAVKFPAKKELFNAFAEEEGQHIDLVSSLLKDVRENVDKEEDIRVAEVINLLEQNEMLLTATKGIERVAEMKNAGEAMSLSSELERVIELFYCQIAMSFEPRDRKILYDLIVEEHKHRLQVEEMTDPTEAGA